MFNHFVGLALKRLTGLLQIQNNRERKYLPKSTKIKRLVNLIVCNESKKRTD